MRWAGRGDRSFSGRAEDDRIIGACHASFGVGPMVSMYGNAWSMDAMNLITAEGQ